jgi:putative ABC transport system ATP-binding protein
MMREGKIVVDVCGEEKNKLTVEALLELFTKASGDEFLSDRAILG